MAFAVLLTSIAFILVAIIVLKLHPFLALILAAILVGLLSPRPLLEGEVESARRQLERELREGVESGALSRENLQERLEGVRWRVEAGKRASKPIQALELTALSGSAPRPVTLASSSFWRRSSASASWRAAPRTRS